MGVIIKPVVEKVVIAMDRAGNVAAIDITTDVSWFEKLVTDIAEDFDARDAQVVIPENVKFLLIDGTDGYVTDNKDDSSYRVEIIKK